MFSRSCSTLQQEIGALVQAITSGSPCTNLHERVKEFAGSTKVSNAQIKPLIEAIFSRAVKDKDIARKRAFLCDEHD